MRRITKIGLTLMLTLFVALGGSAQNKKNLQSQADQLQKEIAAAEKELKKTAQNKQKTLGELNLMQAKIDNRDKLIQTYTQQLKLLDNEINRGNSSIVKLNADSVRLVQEYKKMVEFAYKYRNRYDQLEFFFASKDFNQAMQRMRYIQQFADARKTKIEQMTTVKKKLSAEVTANRKAREQQAALLKEQQAQQEILKQERAELVAQRELLKKQESALVAEINKKNAARKKMLDQYKKLVEEENRKAAAAKATKTGSTKTGSTKSTKTNTPLLTPEEQILSTGFANNKGKLPWPVEKGYISCQFGQSKSQISSKVCDENGGVDITTDKNAIARCVFEGEVTMVFQTDPANQAVFIKHGDYYTGYSGLDRVDVKKGQKVQRKTPIGRVHTNPFDGTAVLNFVVMKGIVPQNPKSWLTPMK